MKKKFEGCSVKNSWYAICYGAGVKKSFSLFKEDNKRVPARKVRKTFNKFWAFTAGVM